MSRRSEFQAALLAWYDAHRRDLPWRRTRDPYAIWVSEAMAQQTTVGVVVPYWLRWIEQFPDVSALAAAGEEDVLALWQGLGYYRRARSLLAGAQAMAASGIPSTVAGWLQVPGVGPYTAAAVASIAFDQPAAVVDGNVERVYARLDNDQSSGTGLKRQATAWADAQVHQERPGDWNQALMELGALVCTPRSPDCGRCPVKQWCKGVAAGDPARLPVKVAKPKPVDLQWTCKLISARGLWALEKVGSGSWWEGMWRFPTEESAPCGSGCHIGTVKHTVTRHRITMAVVHIELTEPTGSYLWVATDEVLHRPLPALYSKAWGLAHNSPVLPGLLGA